MVIPESADVGLAFQERLGRYRKVTRTIQGKSFLFVVEATRPECVHACTIDDIAEVLSLIPLDPIGDLRLIVLRQPKRKEVILSPVWGRLQYGYEFEGLQEPAVIIEAIEPGEPLRFRRKLDLEGLAELERLRSDGHLFRESSRYHESELTVAACRSSQLYRTLLHEFGHYVDYLEKVEHPLREIRKRLATLDAQTDDESLPDDHPLFDECDRVFLERHDRWQTLWDLYWSRPASEHEVFAHSHARRLGAELVRRGAIPFARRLDPESLARDGLDMCDFTANQAS